MDPQTVGLRLGIPVAAVLSLAVVRYLDRPAGRWGRRIRSRLLFGVPWGTVTVVLLVGGVYLVLQGGWHDPRSPLHLPFTSWSYFYPLGVLTAAFSHQSLGHVTGNLLGTLALAPLAEYAFSHFPTGRGRHSFESWRSNPYVRAFVLFPLGVIGLGLLTSVFSWGPIIGFSGVVFAFAGFALVRFPIATVVALIARDTIGTVYRVLRDPILTASASPSFGPPWWAGIAIQGHFLGFLLGVVLGAIVVSRRPLDERPSAIRLWTGGLFVGTNMTLWAIWWYRDGGYVLYRGVGLVLIIALAFIVAVTVSVRDESLIAGISRRQVGIAVLTLPVLTMGIVAVPLNATVLEDPDPPGEAVQIEDYAVTYAEDVPHQRVAAINVSGLGETTQFNVSGVIVTSGDRVIWTESIPKGRLAFAGERTVTVGGVGWRDSVTAVRSGWSVTGGETAYQIALRPSGGNATWVYASEPVQADPTIAGRNVTIEPEEGDFFVAVTADNETLETARIPAENGTITLDRLTVERLEDRLIVRANETRVTVAERESYN